LIGVSCIDLLILHTPFHTPFHTPCTHLPHTIGAAEGRVQPRCVCTPQIAAGRKQHFWWPRNISPSSRQVCIHMYIYTYTYICTYVYFICQCMHIYMFVYIHIYIYTHIYICICIYVFIHIYIYSTLGGQ